MWRTEWTLRRIKWLNLQMLDPFSQPRGTTDADGKVRKPA
jgi:hypothetical protein